VDNIFEACVFFGLVDAPRAGGVTLDYDCLLQSYDGSIAALSASSGTIRVVAAGVMDFHGAGAGVIVDDGIVGLYAASESGITPPRLWGTTADANGLGVDLRAGQVRYVAGSQLTITGPGGDFRVAGQAQARAWDDVLGAYTANLACTWANLIGGALKDNAHALMADATIYKNIGAAQP
jgi:hypothetical protein